MSYESTDKKGYDLTGTLIEKYDTVQRGTFSSREFVLEKSSDFNGKTITHYIKFQCVQDKTAIIDSVNIGDEITVYFNIKGNKWVKDGRTSYFTNLDAWRITPVRAQSSAPAQDEYMEPLDTFTSSENMDDLPF